MACSNVILGQFNEGTAYSDAGKAHGRAGDHWAPPLSADGVKGCGHQTW